LHQICEDLKFGTEWYQFVPSDTNTQHDSPYGSLIKCHRKVSPGRAMPEELFDRKGMGSVAGDATSTNLGDSIDRGVKEMQQHKY
jgi:hypothetical protein